MLQRTVELKDFQSVKHKETGLKSCFKICFCKWKKWHPAFRNLYCPKLYIKLQFFFTPMGFWSHGVMTTGCHFMSLCPPSWESWRPCNAEQSHTQSKEASSKAKTFICIISTFVIKSFFAFLASEYFVVQGGTPAPSVPSSPLQMLKPATGWGKLLRLKGLFWYLQTKPKSPALL